MKTLFFDVDTQIDFVFPAGALYASGAERIVPALARLTQFAEAQGIAVISTVDAHTENDREFLHWPPHCVAGTLGQMKVQPTLLAKRSVVSSKAPLIEWPAGVQQVVLEKQTLDAFDNPGLAGFVGGIDVDRFVVYGVVTEICVNHAVTGLLKTGRRVELVTDAIHHLDEGAAQQMLRQFEAAGGVLTTVQQVCGS